MIPLSHSTWAPLTPSHLSQNIVPFQETIQISRTQGEKEEESTDQNLKKQQP